MMARFSQRFWLQLATLDSKVIAAQRAQRESTQRLLVGRRLVTGESLVDYWTEVIRSTLHSRRALSELNHFCAGRSRPAGMAQSRVLAKERTTEAAAPFPPV